MKLTLTHVLIVAIVVVLGWIGFTLFQSAMKAKETGYFPPTPNSHVEIPLTKTKH